MLKTSPSTVPPSAEEEKRRALHLLDQIVEHVPLMIFLKNARDLSFSRLNRAGEDLDRGKHV